MATVRLEAVSKDYPGARGALRPLSFEIRDGELLTIVGPSGSGKSTILRLIAGLEAPTSGRISIGDRDVTATPPQARDVAMVFQSYALYPHKTVRDNLAFGLRMRGTPRDTATERIQDVAAILAIQPLLDRRPAQLSGGERQRVALGRAMVRHPEVFLLDEPLSNLDPQLRTATRTELALLHRRLGTTMIYVTHDQEEALTLGQRMAVMRDGALEQLGSPGDVFDHPVDTFVAGFVGTPGMNLIPGRARRLDGSPVVECGTYRIPLPPRFRGLDGTADHRSLSLGIRPHDVELTPEASVAHPAATVLRGRVTVSELLGGTALLHVKVDGLSGEAQAGMLRVVVSRSAAQPVGAGVSLALSAERLHLFDGDTGVRIGP